jgi:hypothetical protein
MGYFGENASSGPDPSFTYNAGYNLVTSVERDDRPLLIPALRGLLVYRACITGLKQHSARAACQAMRLQGEYCVILNPRIGRLTVEKGWQAFEIARRMTE